MHFAHIFRRYYAGGGPGKSSVAKKAGAAASGPQKQQFRKKQKDALARAAAVTSSVSQKESLVDALFPRAGEVASQSQTVVPREVLKERATIAKAWSRLNMMRTHEDSSWEHAFLQSKLEASKQLLQVSPKLAQIAHEIDYSLPPIHRRMPTETPPKKFPFSMEVDSIGQLNQ
jgi:hypothetical protein